MEIINTKENQINYKQYYSNADVNLSRSGSFDTGYEGLDDATSGEGR